jgi:hypothetical protein
MTIAEEHDDNRMTLLTGISAFGDSIPPLFISKNNFEAEGLAEQHPFHGHDYLMRSAEKMFMIRVLFIQWFQTQFIPENDQLRLKAH